MSAGKPVASAKLTSPLASTGAREVGLEGGRRQV
jgi:hypothetical protein